MALFHGEKKFFKALREGNTGLVTEYLQRDTAKWLAMSDEYKNSPLHIAAQYSHGDICKMLISMGASINATNRHNQTPLALCARGHQSETIIAALLAAGADVNGGAANNGGPLLATVYGHNTGGARKLLDAGADPKLGTPLITALRYGYDDLATLLLERGADPAGHNGDYVYPLHYTVSKNMRDATRFLLDKQVDVNPRDKSNGDTPLHYAAREGHIAMIDLLLAAGADPTLQNNNGETPLDIARDHEKSAAVARLDKLEQERREEETRRKLMPGITPLDGDLQADSGQEQWLRMGSSKVALVGTYPALGRRLTEIFNFDSRDRIIITENLRTGAENMTQPESFDLLGASPVRKAAEAFNRLGGDIDVDGITAAAAGVLQGKPDVAGKKPLSPAARGM